MNWTIEQTAWSGHKWVQGEISGVIVSFHGLGAPALRVQIEPHEWEWAKRGGLNIFPYYGPWSWMNRQARTFVGELIDKVYAHHKLSDDIPLIITGGSMGGLSALLYTRYARRPVAACAAFIPACDLKAHFHEHPDVPRTVFCAFQDYTQGLEELFQEHSPLSQVDHLPDIPYWIMAGVDDKRVHKELHSDPMVAAMRQRGLRVQYVEASDTEHEEPPPYREKRVEFIRQFLKQRNK